MPSAIFAPRRGLISVLQRRRRQKLEFSEKTLLFHLYNHGGSENEAREAGIATVEKELHWQRDFTCRIINRLVKEEYLVTDCETYSSLRTKAGSTAYRRIRSYLFDVLKNWNPLLKYYKSPSILAININRWTSPYESSKRRQLSAYPFSYFRCINNEDFLISQGFNYRK